MRGSLLLAAALALISSARTQAADLILRHGRVFLGEGRYAESVAVSGNRIAAVGADADVMAAKTDKTRVIELNGRAVVPGFHDAHARLFRGAAAMDELDVVGTKSIEEIRDRLADWASGHPSDEWILGLGWQASDLRDGRLPVRQDLDAVVSSRPVALMDIDGQRIWLNSLALSRAGISARTPKLNNGEIVKDEKGQPTGVLGGEAVKLVTRVIPRATRGQTLARLRAALAIVRASGVTSVDLMPDPGDPPLLEQLELWRDLMRSGEATVRLFIYGNLDDPAGALKLRKKAAGIPRNKVSVPGVAAALDGSLESRRAALLEPYFDEPRSRGELRYLNFRLGQLVRAAHKDGLQVALEASGDRAVRAALDACAQSERRGKDDERVLPAIPCRIERVDSIAPEDIPRFKALSCAASMQPSRLLFDDAAANFVPNRLGDRARWSFAWKALEDSGAVVAFGSDWPSGALKSRRALFAATTRQFLDGKPEQGWIPQERLSLGGAVRHATLDPARLVGLDDELGSIRAGQLADLVVFSDDLFARSGDRLFGGQIDLTVFDGKVVYERQKPAEEAK